MPGYCAWSGPDSCHFRYHCHGSCHRCSCCLRHRSEAPRLLQDTDEQLRVQSVALFVPVWVVEQSAVRLLVQVWAPSACLRRLELLAVGLRPRS